MVPLLLACTGAPTEFSGATADTALDTAESVDTAPVDLDDLPAGVEVLPSTACEPTDRKEWFAELTDALPGQPEDTQAGFGLAIDDLDGDGRRDIIALHNGKMWMFIQETSGVFVERSGERILGSIGIDAVSILDFDLDGQRDLFVSQKGNFSLYLGDAGVFTQTPLTGMPEGMTVSQSLAWADIDGDDDLDLFLGDDGTLVHDEDGDGDVATVRSRLLRRTDTFAFVEAPLPAEVEGKYTKASPFLDLDADGDLDLYLDNHGESGNLVLLNDGGEFSVAEIEGLTISMSGMGIDIADLNVDQRPDFLLSDAGRPRLLLSIMDGTWADAGSALGLDVLEGQTEGWGSTLADFDHDGDFDASMVWGPNLGEDEDQPGSLWENQDGYFVARTAPGEPQAGVSAAAVDLNLDGFLDLILSPNNAPAAVHLGTCDDSSWSTLSLLGTPGNPEGIGARIDIEAGGVTQTRWLFAGGTSYVVSQPVETHVGLNGASRIDRVVVHLGGVEYEWSDLPVNQRLRLNLGG